MDFTRSANLLVCLLDAALLGCVGSGAHLVNKRGGLRRDAPEDAAQPYLDVPHAL
jgi:hypothetical protein